MDIDLSAFHFLRPLWLLLIPLGALLPLLWRRNQDLERRLQGRIAKHLLRHLLLTPQDNQCIRPMHLAASLLVIGGLAAAGPTWQQDRPPFLENRAPLILALDLSPSMDASDVPPSRLEAARHKLHDLIQRRAGARTALIAYAGSAHLVLPATDDPVLLDSFLQALSSDLIERPGKNVVAVIEQAKHLLAAEQVPGTLVLVSDGADTTQLDEVKKQLADSNLQVLILAVGSQDGGVLHDAHGQPRTDSNGRPLLGSFDQKGLQQLADATDAPLGSLTLDGDDLDWIELHAQKHFQDANDQQREIHWKDAGYWLVWPLLLIAFFCVRRGWSVNWSAAVLLTLGFGLQPAPAQAGVLADAFFSADQQGRWAFEHGHYPQAAAHFHDPYWKGIAAYQAADYDLALESFARLDTPQAYFYLGNIYTRRFKFDQAIAAYRQALKLQAQFPEATANLALAIALQKDTQDAAEKAPDVKPDEIKFDNKPGKGKSAPVQTQQAASDALWLNNLSTSPAQFLKRKFSLQDAARPATGSQP
ncbi:VWA domain-containing protein [Aquipseudomonas ullengensis]|uniref:VWA domain-containing protein n=1 Tax=Aquipseudomonas ullengensis TaxID=2759166 RepID=A0A7W4QBZ8_9GAMM|nr:VWA domain-containing protein [Pseudomonas ullengensis]MBB2497010.1 VWA domain-containing protein [Pseudomonas ullengensis]